MFLLCPNMGASVYPIKLLRNCCVFLSQFIWHHLPSSDNVIFLLGHPVYIINKSYYLTQTEFQAPPTKKRKTYLGACSCRTDCKNRNCICVANDKRCNRTLHVDVEKTRVRTPNLSLKVMLLYICMMFLLSAGVLIHMTLSHLVSAHMALSVNFRCLTQILLP